MKPPVEAPTSSARPALDGHVERVERVGELHAAARDVRRRALDLELDLGVDELARVSRRGGGRGRGGHAPAITAAAARVRDSNSPRSASKESRRTRGTGRNGTQAGSRGRPMRTEMRSVLASFVLSRCSRFPPPPRPSSSTTRLRPRPISRGRPADLRRAHRRAREQRGRARVRRATWSTRTGC